jgi:hypothetical protein
VTKVDIPEVRAAFMDAWTRNGNDVTAGESVFNDWLHGLRQSAYDRGFHDGMSVVLVGAQHE